MGIEKETIQQIEAKIHSEDRPEDCWFIETIEKFITEVQRLQQRLEIVRSMASDIREACDDWQKWED